MLKKSAHFFVALLSVFSVHLANCENMTRTRRPQMNIYQIVEFHLNVIGLIESENRMSDYMKFFDEALRAEAQYVFARIHGFAFNESQAAQWEGEAHQFLRHFILCTTAAQAKAHLDAHLIYFCANASAPHTLLEQCVRQVSGHLLKMLNNEYKPLAVSDQILLYELTYVMKLHVIAVPIDKPPYLQLRLTAPPKQRFIDEVRPGNSAFSYPVPYKPLNNYIKDWTPFLNAYVKLNYFALIYKLGDPNEQPLKEYVSVDAFNYTKAYLVSLLPQHEKISKKLNTVVTYVTTLGFLEVLARFLHADYAWLSCHPVYEAYARNNARFQRLIENVDAEHDTDMHLVHTSQKLLRDGLSALNLTYLIETFRAFFNEHNVVAHYATRKPNVVIDFQISKNTTSC